MVVFKIFFTFLKRAVPLTKMAKCKVRYLTVAANILSLNEVSSLSIENHLADRHLVDKMFRQRRPDPVNCSKSLSLHCVDLMSVGQMIFH
jgi:hypothetical protein